MLVRALWLLIGLVGASANAAEPLKPLVVFVAGEASHRYGAHEFNAGGELLVAALNRPESPVRARLHRDGWPAAGLDLSEAAALVLYMDGGDDHPVLPHLEDVDRFAARGGGIMAMHYGIEVGTCAPADAFLKLDRRLLRVRLLDEPDLASHPRTECVAPGEPRRPAVHCVRRVVLLAALQA